MENHERSLAELTANALTKRESRRALIRRAASLGLAVPALGTLLAACAADDDADDPVAPVDDPDDDDEDVSDDDEPELIDDDVDEEPDEEAGGTLVMANYQSNPHPWTFGGNGLWISLLYEPLIQLDNSFDYTNMVPTLAESWEESDDGMVWTFHLREDVTWHDGEPLTSDDVIFSITRSLDPEMPGRNPQNLIIIEGGAAYNAGDADDIPGVSAPDDYTVEIALEAPSPLVLHNLSFIMIQPEHLLGDFTMDELIDDPYFRTDPVGTGPFQLDEMVVDEFQTLVRHDDYWRGSPNLDSIVARQIAQPSVAILALESGEVDLIQVRSPEDAVALMDNPDLDVFAGPPGIGISLEAGNRPPILMEDKRVRQAILYAIDRETIIETLFLGEARLMNSVIRPPWLPLDHLNPYEYDPERATALLQEAGWDAAEEVEITSAYTDQHTTSILSALQQYLGDVGLRTTIRQTESANLADVRLSREFGLEYNGVGQGLIGDPHGTTRYFHSQAPDRASYTGPMFESARVDELFDEGLVETDHERRIEIYSELIEILNDELPFITLWDQYRFWAVRNTVQNIQGKLGAQLHITYYPEAETWTKSG